MKRFYDCQIFENIRLIISINGYEIVHKAHAYTGVYRGHNFYLTRAAFSSHLAQLTYDYQNDTFKEHQEIKFY